ncbi:uncharacterized protein TRAVEDRAFT_48013 [Trametes versicolor FP-101664 SS1]|uniref:uncharacterized protein n=1 Tax=Trametes versicolor (strain FP-101664) TaxID=717944 RepID=UPI0004622211|nr:uncharacterized protein TRAVEDRAFT_48013 [Trametes versicolor FP-101664 SS1]EIW58872.1 hypothetical protein TRAVEDRAFT_48013 [Trametes versicolor FP-101664 SS1]
MAGPSTAHQANGWYPPVISLGSDDPVPPQPAQWTVSQAQSSYRVDTSDLGNRSKLRKVERACDHCRKRKAKCDGPQRKDHICSSCEASARTCKYLDDSKPRGIPKAYIAALEGRIDVAESLLRRLRPELDLTAELGPSPVQTVRENAGFSRPSSSQKKQKGSGIPLQIEDAHPLCQFTTRGESEDPDEVEVALFKGTRLTSRGLESSSALAPNEHQLRFQGKSSSISLISTTMEIIERELAAMRIADGSTQPATASAPPMPLLSKLDRPELYRLLPWETRLGRIYDIADVPDTILSALPPDDLADELIRLFFLHEHVTFPLLHRPTFERQWRDKLHLRSVWFACVCMAVFGLASRWTSFLASDTQSAPEGSGPDALTSLPGWQYVSVTIMASAAITEMQSGLLVLPELCEIQTLVLLSQYLRGTVAADAAWFWLSAGLMKTQDMGLHRRQTYGRTPTVEDELWKRAYWHLVALDRFGSMLLGKPYYAREEDLDLELPLEVDDEYWEASAPDDAFHQVGDKPSLIAGFVCWIKLSHIAATALRTLYSPRRPQSVFVSPDMPWKEAVAEQLNGMLLKWVDELPAHLRWKPDMDDTPSASQAATLFTTYHLLQALIQRPFLAIKSPFPSTAAQKARALYLNASRASADIAHAQLRRGSGDVVTFLHVLSSAIGILLVQLWDLIRVHGENAGENDGRAAGEQMSALLDEISGHLERLQELAPGWELARTML